VYLGTKGSGATFSPNFSRSSAALAASDVC
jgi:hypothetical protein